MSSTRLSATAIIDAESAHPAVATTAIDRIETRRSTAGATIDPITPAAPAAPSTRPSWVGDDASLDCASTTTPSSMGAWKKLTIVVNAANRRKACWRHKKRSPSAVAPSTPATSPRSSSNRRRTKSSDSPESRYDTLSVA